MVAVMRRGQASLEVLIATLLIAVALAATIAAVRSGFLAARDGIDRASGPDRFSTESPPRRGQAVVEAVIALPLIVLMGTFVVLGWARLGEVARAERALGAAQAAIAAGEALPSTALNQGLRVDRRGTRLVARVENHLLDVVVDAAIPVSP